MQPPPYSPIPASPGSTAQAEPQQTFEVPPLPPGVTVEKCYRDFVKYLFENAKSWFLGNSPDGDIIWEKLKGGLKLG